MAALSIFEWLLKMGYTIYRYNALVMSSNHFPATSMGNGGDNNSAEDKQDLGLHCLTRIMWKYVRLIWYIILVISN